MKQNGLRLGAVVLLFGGASLMACDAVLGLGSLKDGPPPDASLSAEAGGEDGGAVDATAIDTGPGDATMSDGRIEGGDGSPPTADDAESDANPDGSDGGGRTDAGMPLGSACSGDAGGGCASGYCVDGVCCDSACTGQCEACNLVDAGGTCSPVSGAPQGPRAACSGAGTVCGGVCAAGNTTGCTYPGSSTSCLGASCLNGIATEAAGCNGSGSCPIATTVPCTNPAACNSAGTGCSNACTSDAQCSSPRPYCNGGSCLGTKEYGLSCTQSSECTNGNCVDGYCCNSGCTEACQACDIAGSQGQCTQVQSGQPHGTRTACTGAGSTCGGYCTTASAATCTYPTGSCGSDSCAGTTNTPAPSCASGACVSAPASPCGTGTVCNQAGNACVSGCYINGTFFGPGVNPGNACESCVPATTTSGWTSTVTWEGLGIGATCTVGVGACASTGNVVCGASGTTASCSATAGTASPGWHSMAAPNGSWDWDCDGTVEVEYPVCNAGNPETEPDCSCDELNTFCIFNQNTVSGSGAAPVVTCGETFASPNVTGYAECCNELGCGKTGCVDELTWYLETSGTPTVESCQ